ncbi:AAA domain-containing protein [Kribbella sp. VKM Ac-2527]|uniref:AAA domain-containing protein n=1 Tax=Kribbella caucasensis TaxID=2512215 RepID=A0A4R6K7K1_9ACTN|nr:ATP-binding protein [Kribbella sp. VKM Ac-2527]TDO44575.1 AAA domain-containing protein [Kribbella sp. VKM Ac-2527]
MKIADKLLNLVGVGRERGLPPPRLVAIADGLLVTERSAEAWYLISVANTDLATEAEQDAALDAAVSAAATILGDRLCHLKVVWGRSTGQDYLDSVAGHYRLGDHEAWAQTRGDRIDEMRMPERYVALGVHLSDRDPRATAQVRGSISDALGTTSWRVSARELTHLDERVRKLARQLGSTVWRAHTAPAEVISWLVSREMHRGAVAAPRRGLITGASLARLTAGRVVPYTDHLRIFDTRGQIAAFTTVLAMTDFPEELETPGPGEWLRTLSEIKAIDDDGDEIDVTVEASVRFRVLTKKTARHLVDETRKSAKEQRRSAAKGTAEETADEIVETERIMREVKRDINRSGLTLVEDHPRLLVSADTREDLETYVDAVVAHYADRGITVAAGADEQRDLWLESLPGDQLRVPDLGHVRESTAFFGSWFWGGASIGDATGPSIGYLTGSTPGLVRFDAAAGSALGDATTTLFLGRSGRGKTTAAMLGGLDSAFAGAWVPLLDLKGDAAGVSAVAAEYGVPTAVIEITAQFSGAADLLRVLPVDDALLQAPSQLMLLLPPHLRGAAEAPVVAATRAEIQSPDPSSWGVIQRLCASESETTRTVGFALRDLVETGLGSVVAGPPSGLSSLTTNPGLWVVQMPGLTLPSPESAPESWSPIERVGMACLRGCLAWMVRTTGRREFRGRSKVVIVPEVHLLTKTPDGASFLDYIARVGRALGASLVLDTQDPASILKLPGLVEQITTLFAFSLRSREQVDSLLELLGRPQTPPYQTLVRGINTAANGKSIRHGHCIMRDRWDEVATVQIDIPSQRVAELLRTTPESEHDQEPTQPILLPYEEPDPFADDDEFEDDYLEPAATAQANLHPHTPAPANAQGYAPTHAQPPAPAEEVALAHPQDSASAEGTAPAHTQHSVPADAQGSAPAHAQYAVPPDAQGSAPAHAQPPAQYAVPADAQAAAPPYVEGTVASDAQALPAADAEGAAPAHTYGTAAPDPQVPAAAHPQAAPAVGPTPAHAPATPPATPADHQPSAPHTNGQHPTATTPPAPDPSLAPHQNGTAPTPTPPNGQDRPHHPPRYDEPIGPDEVYDQEADEAAYNEAMYHPTPEDPPGGDRPPTGKKEHVA